MGMVLASVLLSTFKEETVDALDWMRQHQPESCFYYVLFFAIWVMCCLSKSVLSVGAGYIYGFGLGFVCSVVGMLLALAGSVVVVRVVCSRAAGNPRQRFRNWLLIKFPSMAMLNRMIKTEPFKVSLLIRLTYLPTFAKNYGLASLDTPLLPLVGATVLSSCFYCVIFCYLGSVLSSVEEIAGGSKSKSPLEYMMMSVGLLLTLGVLVIVRHKVKQEARVSAAPVSVSTTASSGSSSGSSSSQCTVVIGSSSSSSSSSSEASICGGDGGGGAGMEEVVCEDHRLESSHEHQQEYEHQHQHQRQRVVGDGGLLLPAAVRQHDYAVHAVLGSASGLDLEEGRGDSRGAASSLVLAAQPGASALVHPRQQEYQPQQRGQGFRSGGGGPTTGRIAVTAATELADADQRMRLGGDSSYSASADSDSSMSMDLSLALPPIQSPRGSLPPVKGPPVSSARAVEF